MKKEIKKTKSYWLFIALGSLLLLIALFLAPFWGKIWSDCPWKDFGIQLVSYAMAAMIVMYLVGFLFKKILSSRGVIKVLTIIEFTLLALIAVGLVFSQLAILNIPDSPSMILGIALYIRGVIEVFRAYYHQKDSKVKYSTGWLIVAILMITGGVVLITTNLVQKMTVLVILLIALFVLGISSIVYGILAKPKTTKVKKNKE